MQIFAQFAKVWYSRQSDLRKFMRIWNAKNLLMKMMNKSINLRKFILTTLTFLCEFWHSWNFLLVKLCTLKVRINSQKNWSAKIHRTARVAVGNFGPIHHFGKSINPVNYAKVNKLTYGWIHRIIGKKFVYLLKCTEFICAHASKTDFPKWCIHKRLYSNILD